MREGRGWERERWWGDDGIVVLIVVLLFPGSAGDRERENGRD